MKILRGLYAILRALLTIVLVALLAIILTQRISDNKMSIAGIRIFTIVTESMAPEYVVGDSILVKQATIEELNEGDDITYLGTEETFKDKIVTHRIVKKEIREDGTYKIVTKGIANDVEDPPINDTQIYGKVIYKIKSISYINGIVGNLYGMYFCIIVPMALMMFFEYLGYKKDKEKELGIEEEKKEDDEKDNNKRKNKRRARREKRRKRMREREENNKE